MSVGIHFEHIVKKYGENVIIPDLNLDVREGEFFTLLGPSGCGKTTLLRMVAGFNSIEGGTIAFNGRVINDIAPNKRNIGMVFQNYAVFPHMTVRENVAFGLENRHLPKNEIKRRVDEILETVKITQYADRLPERLSGGQQQRVALARAIVIKPDVLLMDEPLSNLDAKLRIEMRNAIRQIQNSVGITTIYVLLIWILRKLPGKELFKTIGESVKETAAITFIIGCSTFLAYVITRGQLPQMIVDAIVGAHVSKIVVLLLINLLLIVMGMLLAPAAALLIVTPLLVPIAKAYSIDLVQLGLIVVYNLNLGCLTPPVAVSLYMTARMSGTTFAEQVKESMPFFAISIVILILITYVPDFVLFLPKLLYA